MRILVAGATGSIGIHVVNTAIAMGHQPVTLVRNRRKIKLLPRGTDIFYGDVSIPETLTDLPKDIDAIIFTLGSDGQGRIGARAIDYGGVRNILRIFMDTPIDGTNILPFQARYIALGQSVAGTANADATFKVQYL